MIQVTANDTETGKAVLSESFLQNSDTWCDKNQECSILFYVTSNAEIQITVSAIDSTNLDQCSLPTNSYVELICMLK